MKIENRLRQLYKESMCGLRNERSGSGSVMRSLQLVRGCSGMPQKSLKSPPKYVERKESTVKTVPVVELTNGKSHEKSCLRPQNTSEMLGDISFDDILISFENINFRKT